MPHVQYTLQIKRTLPVGVRLAVFDQFKKARNIRLLQGKTGGPVPAGYKMCAFHTYSSIIKDFEKLRRPMGFVPASFLIGQNT